MFFCRRPDFLRDAFNRELERYMHKTGARKGPDGALVYPQFWRNQRPASAKTVNWEPQPYNNKEQ